MRSYLRNTPLAAAGGRGRDTPRDFRWMLGCGAALGAVALVMLSDGGTA